MTLNLIVGLLSLNTMILSLSSINRQEEHEQLMQQNSHMKQEIRELNRKIDILIHRK